MRAEMVTTNHAKSVEIYKRALLHLYDAMSFYDLPAVVERGTSHPVIPPPPGVCVIPKYKKDFDISGNRTLEIKYSSLL